jgi:phage repressor protein C with HTH and peptisase S24 domain
LGECVFLFSYAGIMNAIIPNRLQERLEMQGISQSELARRIGVKQPSIARLISGETQTSRHLHLIARELATTPDYLTGGTDSPTGNIVASPTVPYRSMPAADINPALIAEQLGSVLIPQLEIGYSMGGGSVFADYQQTAMVPFPREWLRPMIKGRFDDLFVARGDGDSMMPTLLDGDLVIVDTAQKNITQQDRLWCLSYGDLGMIKRVRLLPDGGVQVNSDNPAVTPITAYDGELHIVGRVIWIGRRV